MGQESRTGQRQNSKESNRNKSGISNIKVKKIAKLQLDGNEKLLKKMREKFQNGRINRERKIIDKLIQEYPDARRRSNGNNVMYSGQRGKSEQNDRLHINGKEINEKIRGRQDSKKSTRNKSGIDSEIRAERTSSTPNRKIEYDSKGNKLSKSQQEFFKDSKVRDEKGKLLVMYHGTDKNFFEFKNKKPQHGRAIIDGYYLTPEKSIASEYGSNIMEVYVDLKNPFYLHNNNGLTKELIDRGYANSTSELIEKYNLETDDSKVVPTSKALTKLVKKLGYDGIITTTLDSDNIDADFEYTQIVALNSNQIKNITNQNPTSSQDIRYEKKDKSDNNSEPYDERKYEKNEDFMNYLKDNNYLKTLMEIDSNQGETYAHSPNRLIEQEIRRVDSTTGFDNTIPVTKLMDIDREIEKYLMLKETKEYQIIKT